MSAAALANVCFRELIRRWAKEAGSDGRPSAGGHSSGIDGSSRSELVRRRVDQHDLESCARRRLATDYANSGDPYGSVARGTWLHVRSVAIAQRKAHPELRIELCEFVQASKFVVRPVPARTSRAMPP